MLIALTFLGTGQYQKTTYIKHDDETSTCETDLFPIAVERLYKPDRIIAFTTPKVINDKQDDLNKLKREFSDKFSTERIPNGNSPQELWEIFNNCINVFTDEDNSVEKKEIILDITHAFRSIPLLIFIVAAYLRQVKNIELKHIIYGAFEARNEKNNETPIFDLTPFVELLDWMNAFTIFQRSGDAGDIAKLNLPNSIENALTNVSVALLTNRTFEAQETISRFVKMNLNHPESLSRQPVPFQMLTERLKESYKNIGVNQPRNEPQKSLKAQYEQIKWYVVNQHYLQAITLMREWMVSWECIQNEKEWLNQEVRRTTEDELNERMDHQNFRNLDFTKLWRQCRDLRNDLAHCGMREDPRRSHVAINATQKLFSEFEKFVQKNLT